MGKLFAFVLAIVGVFGNLFLVVLAFFLYVAASGEAQQTAIAAAFDDVAVADVMTREADLSTVSTDASVADLLARMFAERHVGYPVVRDERLVGMVTLDDATAVDEVERDAYRVADVMSSDLHTVAPDADAMTAFRRMREHDVGRLPVVDETGALVGLVSRTDMMRALEVIQRGGPPRALRRESPSVGVR